MPHPARAEGTVGCLGNINGELKIPISGAGAEESSSTHIYERFRFPTAVFVACCKQRTGCGLNAALGSEEGAKVMRMFRNVLLALVAITVLVGSAVPANAAMRHHHKGHHHHRHR